MVDFDQPPTLVRSREASGFFALFLLFIVLAQELDLHASRAKEFPASRQSLFPGEVCLIRVLLARSGEHAANSVVECCSVLWGELPLAGEHRLDFPPKRVLVGTAFASATRTKASLPSR